MLALTFTAVRERNKQETRDEDAQREGWREKRGAENRELWSDGWKTGSESERHSFTLWEIGK